MKGCTGGGVCLYDLFIRFVYTGDCVVKVFRGFRFDPELYAGFKRVACAGGCTVTGRLSGLCVAAWRLTGWFLLSVGFWILRLKRGFLLIGWVR